MNNRKPSRLPEYDYSQDGYYFVTVCTKDKYEWFGGVENDVMVLNEYGQIARKIWPEIPEHFKNIKLDEFIVMPSHVHGIIIIQNESVGNRHACSLRRPQCHILSVVIGSYKSAVARYIHQTKNGHDFYWQKSFYDHVIRGEKELIEIREYIVNNPKQWELDVENVGHRHACALQ